MIMQWNGYMYLLMQKKSGTVHSTEGIGYGDRLWLPWPIGNCMYAAWLIPWALALVEQGKARADTGLPQGASWDQRPAEQRRNARGGSSCHGVPLRTALSAVSSRPCRVWQWCAGPDDDGPCHRAAFYCPVGSETFSAYYSLNADN
jgi:hypothetical protein